MLKLNSQTVLMFAILFAIINNSIFRAFHPTGVFRLAIVIFMNLSIILIVWNFINILKKNINIHPYFKVMYSILIAWSLFIIFRSFNFGTAMTLFGHYGGAWTWVVPICAAFGFSMSNWLYSFKFLGSVLFIGSLAGLGSFFYYNNLVWGFLELMAVLPVMMLTFSIQNRRNRLIILFAIVSYLIMIFKVSSRISVIFLILIFLINTMEFLKYSRINIFGKSLLISLILISGSFLILELDNFVNKISKNKEATTDTRTFLFVEQFADMDADERIIGRGAMGTYYSEYFELWNDMGMENGDSSIRWTNEVGYLHMILKGGYVMVILYLMILIPAAYLGIFRSKNNIARMCGYLILLYIILWPISFSPTFGAQYILLWMATGTAVSSSARNFIITKRRKESIQNLSFEQE